MPYQEEMFGVSDIRPLRSRERTHLPSRGEVGFGRPTAVHSSQLDRLFLTSHNRRQDKVVVHVAESDWNQRWI